MDEKIDSITYDKPEQGRRTDIICVKRKIDEDPTKSIWDIAKESDTTYKVVMRHRKAFAKYAKHKLRKLHLAMEHTPTVHILYGPNCTDKSEWLDNLMGAGNVATVPLPTSTWWINEQCARAKYLRVNVGPKRVPPLDLFLSWTGNICKPYNVKGGGSMTMRPEIIVFTSNQHPATWWPNISDEHLQAVCERITGGIYRTRENKEPHLEFKWGEGFNSADFYSQEEVDSLTGWYNLGTAHIRETP